MPRLRPLIACAALVLVALAPPAARAADEAETPSPLRPGAWALQFAIRDNFQLGSFAGSTISVKRHSSARRAWRAGVDLSLVSSDDDRSSTRPDTVVTNEAEYNFQGIGLELHRLHYIGGTGSIHPFVGLGPEGSWSHRKQSFAPYDETRRSTSWSAGLGSDLGVEWTVARSIGVHAEYGVGLLYRKSTETVTRVADPFELEERRESRTWQLANRGVRFGLSAYF